MRMMPAIRSGVATLVAAACIAAVPVAHAAPSDGDAAREVLRASIDAYAPRMAEVAHALWEQPELGYLETHSSRLLQDELAEAGFEVRAGIAGMPTAFVASAGNGKGPVIALLAEMDALPGMSQAAVPRRAPIAGQDAGQACGHNLFGAGSVAAARAIAQWLRETDRDGEVRVYGTPAEEGGSGKVYLVRAGAFDDVDVVLHWHPGDGNSAAQARTLANISGTFHFTGVASHAAIAPERGRSALDGVEALDFMANMMREHVPQQTRIHYVITDGGDAPNVVPDSAAVYYYVRHPEPEVVRDVFARLQAAAEGAAQGTGTRVAFEQSGGVFSVLPNDTLGRVLDASLRAVGGVGYGADDTRFATALQETLASPPPLAKAAEIGRYSADGQSFASTDVGDVSWAAPTAGIGTATWVPGTAAHSWQAVAASGHAIGAAGAEVAARALALAATRLYEDPALVRGAREEFERRRGADFSYRPLLERAAPPLDYRATDQD
ncbi:amidohydrolase [Luteimonas soli]|uniref:Amidohydrolase n=1 Tax=Luteimonas soli TaxID=1648966 RepID=A0ABV7XM50_9GAMM